MENLKLENAKMDDSKMVSDQLIEKCLQNLELHIKQVGLIPSECQYQFEGDKPDKPGCYYSFGYQFGGTFFSYPYDVIEQGRHRAYVFGEVHIHKFTDDIHPDLLESLFKQNVGIPHPFKICLTEGGVLSLAFRLPIDAISDNYFSELLFGLEPFGSTIADSIKQFLNKTRFKKASTETLRSMN